MAIGPSEAEVFCSDLLKGTRHTVPTFQPDQRAERLAIEGTGAETSVCPETSSGCAVVGL